MRVVNILLKVVELSASDSGRALDTLIGARLFVRFDGGLLWASALDALFAATQKPCRWLFVPAGQ